ncbi:bacteriorhodopsin [Rubrobacter aplysinae]|uniref:bacteriorhodopsin n=1 Tax=Rubrobacter aplysinae TaxID=909625 RepID=UPI0009FD7C88|nr:bacteriorhodopsin [Rubrobacter aplysinae]
MQLALLQGVLGELVQEGSSVFWLWIGAGGFFLATAWFVYLAATSGGSHTHHYVASTIIVLWAGVWYAIMATGGAISLVSGPGGEPVVYYFGRYIDWTLTTPLLLLGLAWVGLGGTGVGNRSGLIWGLVIADVLMILTGVVAGATTAFVSGLFFVLSTIFFLIVLALVWGPLRSAAQQGEPEGGFGLFYTLATMLTVLWIIYPIVWLIGTEGAGLVTAPIEVFLYAVLDVLAKIAFGAILLGGVRRASGGQQQSGGGSQRRAARVS